MSFQSAFFDELVKSAVDAQQLRQAWRANVSSGRIITKPHESTYKYVDRGPPVEDIVPVKERRQAMPPTGFPKMRTKRFLRMVGSASASKAATDAQIAIHNKIQGKAFIGNSSVERMNKIKPGLPETSRTDKIHVRRMTAVHEASETKKKKDTKMFHGHTGARPVLIDNNVAETATPELSGAANYIRKLRDSEWRGSLNRDGLYSKVPGLKRAGYGPGSGKRLSRHAIRRIDQLVKRAAAFGAIAEPFGAGLNPSNGRYGNWSTPRPVRPAPPVKPPRNMMAHNALREQRKSFVSRGRIKQYIKPLAIGAAGLGAMHFMLNSGGTSED